MYKYILKKDLPFAKAGKELSILNNKVIVWQSAGNMSIPPGATITACPICDDNELEKLTADGWIEKKIDGDQEAWKKEVAEYFT